MFLAASPEHLQGGVCESFALLLSTLMGRCWRAEKKKRLEVGKRLPKVTGPLGVHTLLTTSIAMFLPRTDLQGPSGVHTLLTASVAVFLPPTDLHCKL